MFFIHLILLLHEFKKLNQGQVHFQHRIDSFRKLAWVWEKIQEVEKMMS